MKKIIFLPLIVAGLLYSDTEISFSRTFETSLQPDRLMSTLTFTSSKLSQKETTDKLTAISDYMHSIKNVKVEGGNYSINPHIVYDNGKSYQDGYDGYVSYNASSKNPNELNKFIRNVQKIGENNSLSVSVVNAGWSISSEQNSDDISDSLKIEALLWTKDYANRLSNKIGQNCRTSKVDFANDGYARPMMMKATAMNDSAPTPMQDDQKIQINANIIIECK